MRATSPMACAFANATTAANCADALPVGVGLIGAFTAHTRQRYLCTEPGQEPRYPT